MKRESFIFYKSFYESIKELDPLDQVQIYDAIFKYQFEAEEIELKGICKSIFTLIIPQLEANNKRYLNGLKGGAPKGNQNATKKQPKNNLELTKKQPNENVNVNDNENVNVNDNENVNVNDNENVNVKGKDKKEKYGEFNNVMLTNDEYKKLEEKNALSQIENLSRYLASTGKRYKSHYATILNWDRRDKQQQEENKYKGMSYREREYYNGLAILEQYEEKEK